MVKKINAVLGLAIIALLLVHISYEIYAYLTFYYNPVLTKVIAYAVLVSGCLHILLSCFSVFVLHDKGNGLKYPALNVRTIIQRISAIVMAVLIILHLNTFAALKSSSQTNRVLFFAVLVLQLLFYAVTLLHIGVSVSNAFITLGLIGSEKGRKRLDVFVWILCVMLFVAAAFVVTNTQIAMFLKSGGAA